MACPSFKDAAQRTVETGASSFACVQPRSCSPSAKVSLHIPLGCLPHAYVLYSSIKINLPRVSAGFCLSPVHSPNAPTRPAGASVRPLLSSRPSRSVRSRSFIVVSIRAGMGLYFCNSRVRRSAQYKVTAKVTTAVTTITNHMRSRGTVLLRHFIGAKAAEPWAPCRSSCLTAPSARRLCHGPHVGRCSRIYAEL
jgi:hypothetical protein